MPSLSAFRFRIAVLVSRSGDWMSAIRPHSNRDRSRSYQQYVDAAIALAEVQDAVVAHGVDHLVHEALGRDVGELQILQMRDDVMSDGVHQVRLAQPDPAVDEQRVIRARRRFRHGAARRVRELIRCADDEGVEGIAWAENAEIVGVYRNVFLERRLGLRDLGHERRAYVLRHEGDGRAGSLHLGEGFIDHRRVMFRQPVAEEGIRNTHPDRAVAVGDKRGGLEPGVKAVSVDLRLDAGQDLVPDVAGGHVVSGTFRPLGNHLPAAARCQPAVYPPVTRG